MLTRREPCRRHESIAETSLVALTPSKPLHWCGLRSATQAEISRDHDHRVSKTADGTTDTAIPDALRARYRAGVAAALTVVEQLAGQLGASPGDPAVIESLRRELHRLHGSAGSYGFADASRLAAKLESRLVAWSTDVHAEAADRASMVANFVRAFRRAVVSAAEHEPSSRRTLLLFGLDDAHADAFAAEAALRGIDVARASAESALTADATAAAHAIITLATLVPKLPASTSVPVLALATPVKGRKKTKATGVPAIPIARDDPAATVMDLLERIAKREDHGQAKLLVVDDDPAMLEVVRAIAQHDGFRVLTLDEPARLADVIARERPTLILMDVQMGDLSGVEATRLLRRDPAHRDLPILLYSGRTDAASRERAIGAGADGLIAKPIVPAELRQRLREQVERRRLRRLADGVHPELEVTLPDRTIAESAEAWRALPGASVAVIHPAKGYDPREWMTELRRLSSALRPHAGALGLGEGDVLVGVFREEPAAICARLAELSAANAAAPWWNAGVAGPSVAGAAFERVHRAAMEALDVARRSGRPGVHQWTMADEAVAPDVIIVEDDAALSDMVQYALHQSGYTYRSFTDGEAAYEALRTLRTGDHRPIVLLDIDLPGMDGHSLQERLRVERPGAYIIVVMSVHAGESNQVRALDAGAWDYLPKPLNLRVLMAKLPMWLARSAAAP
jgi:DNA-binding response OmpR family regulator/HPt (histidine-containing phosphotransfer) domain-containing protein